MAADSCLALVLTDSPHCSVFRRSSFLLAVLLVVLESLLRALGGLERFFLKVSQRCLGSLPLADAWVGAIDTASRGVAMSSASQILDIRNSKQLVD